MSMCVGFVEEAPEQDGIHDEGGRRMKEIVTCNPKWIVEVQVIKDTVHHAIDGFGCEITIIDKVSDGKKEQSKVRRY